MNLPSDIPSTLESIIKRENSVAYEHVQQGNWEGAIEHYTKSLELDPSQGLIHYALASSFLFLTDYKSACKHYQISLEISPQFYPSLWGDCISSLFEIYDSREHQETARKRYAEKLIDLRQKTLIDPDAVAMTVYLGATYYPFLLAYHGQNDRELQVIYGEMLCACMAKTYPMWAQKPAMPPLEKGERLRVGFATAFFRLHSVWKMPLGGWIQHIDPAQFETFGYHTGQRKDDITLQAYSLMDHFHEGTFQQLADQIRRDNLHVLIFPEIGMDPISTQLASLNLAPVQCNSWGHPITCGMPTIDYFLSSEYMESTQSRDHYSENLILLPHLGFYYTPLQLQDASIDAEKLGIKASCIKYLCCQSLFKYMPQYDEIFVTLAKEVPRAQFIFIYDTDFKKNNFLRRLDALFAKHNLRVNDYVIMVPRLSMEQFSTLCKTCDIFLDSIGWSGCNSTIEALEQGLPVITLPGTTMRSRHSFAILKHMNMTQTVVNNIEEYVAMAKKLADEPILRSHLRQEILQKCKRLAKDESTVRGFENFLHTSVQKALQKQGSKTSSI